MAPIHAAPVFDGFRQNSDTSLLRRLVISGGASAAAVTALVSLAMAWPQTAPASVKPAEKPIEVVFRAPPPPPPPPPPAPPPPPPAAKPPPARVARAAPRPPGRVVAAVVAPKEIPKELPPPPSEPVDEAPPPEDPSEMGDVNGDPNAPVADVAPTAEPVAAAPKKAAPIHLPENGEPAVEVNGNTPPEFPADALRLGKQALVILRIVISASGGVDDVQVLKGEEPFVKAAVSAVSGWRYQPARLDGQAIAVYRIVKVPFVIRN